MSTRSAPYDATAMLSLSLHANPGVYALLVGSGISVGAGVATGWGVVEALVRKLAAVEQTENGLPGDFDIERWWSDKYPGIELGYDSVLDASAMTGSERRRLLEPFFVPSEDDRQTGKKVPAPAHKAIARLVDRGAVRVIVTTNFDDLIEKALGEIGVPYQVIASPSDISGVDALRHASCTVVKVHGDYRRIDVLNTGNELAAYHADLDKLLDEVFDDYGLLVCGWSADWDTALVDAIRRAPARRYPLYWATRGDLADNTTTNANDLLKQRRGQAVPVESADQFFTTLVESLDALDRMAQTPLTRDLALAHLKRYLPDPVRRLDLRELFEGEIARVANALPEATPGQPDWSGAIDRFASDVDLLSDLLVTGIVLDTTHDHDDLWVWVIEELMRANRPPIPGEFHHQAWQAARYYPAWLALMAASYAAVYAGRDDLLIRLFLEPTTSEGRITDRTTGRPKPEAPAVEVLYDYALLSEQTNITSSLYQDYQSHIRVRMHTRERVHPILEPIVRNASMLKVLDERVEYRIALIQQSVKSPSVWTPVLEYTRYAEQFRVEGEWDAANDFSATADATTWVKGLHLGDHAAFDALRTNLEDHARNWGTWW